MTPDVRSRIAAIAGSPVSKVARLTGGCIAFVYSVEFERGDVWVAKVGRAGDDLSLEGRMLAFLKNRSLLPVPDVHHSSPELLLMSRLAGTTGLSPAAESDAARHVAALHAITDAHFGLDFDTLIGPLSQPNPKSEKWLPFFRDHRLMYMARLAREAGRLPGDIFIRIEKMSRDLDRWLIEPDAPSLLHGDLWGGNILSADGKITGFVDPAISFGHAEIELAYSTLFSTFDEPFFKAYEEVRPLQPGFFDVRLPIYLLYPLLVHVRLFGGSYVRSVETTLSRFGF